MTTGRINQVTYKKEIALSSFVTLVPRFVSPYRPNSHSFSPQSSCPISQSLLPPPHPNLPFPHNQLSPRNMHTFICTNPWKSQKQFWIDQDKDKIRPKGQSDQTKEFGIREYTANEGHQWETNASDLSQEKKMFAHPSLMQHGCQICFSEKNQIRIIQSSLFPSPKKHKQQ